MNKILSLFQFGDATWLKLLGRFGVLILLSTIVLYVAALIIIQIRKRKPQEGMAFTLIFNQSILWSINIVLWVIAIVLFFTIRSNGGYYFAKDALEWSLYCGWVLILPELLLVLAWVVLYAIIHNHIKKINKY